MKCSTLMSAAIMLLLLLVHKAPAQERKIERLRIGGGSASTTQMSLWFAKEGNFFDKHGLNVEAISILAARWHCKRCSPASCRSSS